ncbi:hypothetical protein M9H77_18922 [Catharanthus roseus]|uniref:Uncharacterized protein n=1 Tax=Catharanthus roseus TaxID=4058 RepID=A0ACC0B8U9_CATRO|nr:hypothetical protein M9H77_18922 [Catharanthus roseus]
MPLFKVIGMTPTDKNFIVATAFMRNEQRYIDQNVLAKLTEMIKDEEVASRTCLNPLTHKFVRVWTKSVMNFGVETTNRVESEDSVLKLWLSTCHGDLYTVFLNIDSLIEGQIADIKPSLEFFKTKEKFANSNSILRMVSNKISHLALKEIWNEISRVTEIIDDPKNKCGHYMGTSHDFSCSCEFITQFYHTLPI